MLETGRDGNLTENRPSLEMNVFQVEFWADADVQKIKSASKPKNLFMSLLFAIPLPDGAHKTLSLTLKPELEFDVKRLSSFADSFR